MKIVIHAGMHKTGSSSIQYNLARCNDPNLKYAAWQSPNHSTMFALLFGPIEKTTKFHIFRRARLSTADAQAERVKWLAELEKDIAAATGRTFLFSAEVFSAPNSHSRIRDAAQFFREQGDVRVIAYVRPPISYMQSAIQQRLKGGNKIANFDALYPNYRQRFEILDNFFGRENVELIKYDRNSLHRGDVVYDFASRIGVNVSETIIAPRNESLSLEAAGALYIQRNMGSGYPEEHAQARIANKQFINVIRKLGSTKITFSSKLVDPIIHKFNDDISWIENRMGQSVLDSPSDNASVSSFDDITAGAISIIPELESFLGSSLQDERSLDYVVSLIEKVKLKCDLSIRHRRSV